MTPPRNPMTRPNDEHFYGCLNALTRDDEKRAAHRAARAATLDGEPVSQAEADAHRELATRLFPAPTQIQKAA